MNPLPQLVERELLSSALTRLAGERAFSVVFGGLSTKHGLEVTELHGNRGTLLKGLRVAVDRGLGGRTISERRARTAADYRTSRHITHDYDREVLSEGIRTLLAVPVIVDGHVRAVIYGGVRLESSFGGYAVQPAVRAAASLAHELSVHDRIARLSAAAKPLAIPRFTESAPIVSGVAVSGLSSSQLEELRASYAELRAISASVTDPALAERLHTLEARLAGIAAPRGDAEGQEIRLSPRETDVLGFVALGRKSQEIAVELGLTESTVKSYLATAMRKLGAHTRHEAVATARRVGLLP